MLVSELERKLKTVDPLFSIRYKHSVPGMLGHNIAGVFYGSKHICRIPQGEITLMGRTENKVTKKAPLDRLGNPMGQDTKTPIKHRGLRGMIKMIRKEKLLNSYQEYYLLDPTT